MKICRYKKESKITYALGATLVFELIKTAPDLLCRLFFHPDLDKTSREVRSILSFCNANKIDIIESAKAFNILSPKGNTFLIAEFEKKMRPLDNDDDHIVLVNPSDAGNVGTIIRAAVGFGFKNVAIVCPAVDVFNPKAVRATMGAIFHINIFCYKSIDDYMNDFPGHSRYAFMLQNALDYSTVSMSSPCSLIFGNEATGLPDKYAEFCKAVKIPQSENIDSLSLPMATTIVMYEKRKI